MLYRILSQIEKCIQDNKYCEEIQKILLSSLNNALKVHTEIITTLVSDIDKWK